MGNEQVKNENYEEHLYDRKDDPNLVTPLHVPRHTLNDHTTSSKHGKKAWKGSSQQKKDFKMSKKGKSVDSRKKTKQIQVNFFRKSSQFF